MLFFILPVSLNYAQTLKNTADRFIISLDEQDLNYDHPTFEIGGAKLVAEKAVINQAEEILSLQGNVVFSDYPLLVYAKSAEVDIKTNIITLRKASFFDPSNQMYATVDRIEKLSDQRYYLKNITFTQCLPDKKVWEIKASEMYYEVENYVYGYHTRFELLGVPIFYLPISLFPAVSKRKSGFLPPITRHERVSGGNGYGYLLKVPYFFNFGQDHGLTLDAELYSSRGTALGLSYDYAFKEGQRGQAYFWFIDEHFKDRKPAEEYLMGSGADNNPTRHNFSFYHRGTSSGYSQLFLSAQANSDNEIINDYHGGSTDQEIRRTLDGSLVFGQDFHYLLGHGGYKENFLHRSRYDQAIDLTTLNQMDLHYEKTWVNIGGINLQFLLGYDGALFERETGWEGQKNKAKAEAGYQQRLSFLKFDYDLDYQFLSYQTRYFPRDSSNLNFAGNVPFQYQIVTHRFDLSASANRKFLLEDGSIRKLQIIPFLEFIKRNDVDQRKLLNIGPNDSLSYNSHDYSQFGQKFSKASLILARESLDFGFELNSKIYPTSNSEITPEWRLKLYSTWNNLRASNLEQKESYFQGPAIEEEYQETAFGEKFLPLRLRLNYSPNRRIEVKSFFRYHVRKEKFLERSITISIISSEVEKALITYRENLLSYKDLDGNFFAKKEDLSLQYRFSLNDSWLIGLNSTWNFLRRDLVDRADYKRVNNLLTHGSIDFRYIHCCYQLDFGYQETIDTKIEVGNITQEYIKRNFYLSFTLLKTSFENNFDL